MSDKDPKGALQLNEFLNPASMLTPGLAGSMTMLITNALSSNFEVTPSWTGLLISFLCGTLVFASSVGMPKKLVYYVLNSLIIFSVAAGTSGFAATVTRTVSIGFSPVLAASRAPSETAFVVAQADTTESAAQPSANLQAKLDAARLERDAALKEAAAAKMEAEALKEMQIPAGLLVGGLPNQAAFELAFWDAIQASHDPVEYQAYLEAYPKGSFAPLARSRVQSLEAKAVEKAARDVGRTVEKAVGDVGRTLEKSAGDDKKIDRFFKHWF